MAANPRSYVAAGYFLSRDAGVRDETGTELRPITLASDHTPRRFFPGPWALSWCGEQGAQRVERAAAFGIAERELAEVTAWADRSFGAAFGAWDVFFKLDGAREAARTFLRRAQGLELWGVGLHQSLVRGYCKVGASFNSPQSLHLDEGAVLRAAGVVPNADGLIDSINDALACCRLLDALAPETHRGITGWLPWLVVRYPL